MVRVKVRPLISVGALMLALTMSASACGGTGYSGDDIITVYSADGLSSWYKDRFAAFTRTTGKRVNYVETGSSETVARVQNERRNTQADIVVTLPPFIQDLDKRGLLQNHDLDLSSFAPTDHTETYVSLVDNYPVMIVNKDLDDKPRTWDDLLDPRYRKRLQYSTPGQAGDGTALLVLLEGLWGKDKALDYLTKLQRNNVGPSKSTGALQEKTSRGDIWVGNGDVQMNLSTIQEGAGNFDLFFPEDADGVRNTVALPYVAGLVDNAPHTAAARELLKFLVSTESQRTVAKVAVGYPVAPTAADTIDAQLAAAIDGVRVIPVDWAAVASRFREDMTDYDKAVNR